MDQVGRVAAEWKRRQPDWDVTGMLIFGRLARLQRIIDRERTPLLAEANLNAGDVDLLSALWRNEDGVRPKDLRAQMMIGSGTLTARLDRLQQAGLLERRQDPDDRRGRVIQLTTHGLDVLIPLVRNLLAVENGLLRRAEASSVNTLAAGLAAVVKDLEKAGGLFDDAQTTDGRQ